MTVLGTAAHSAQGRARFWRGAANPCARAPLCDPFESDGRLGGVAAILLVSSERRGKKGDSKGRKKPQVSSPFGCSATKLAGCSLLPRPVRLTGSAGWQPSSWG